ncbi:MAG: hypothetical protein ORN29_04710 [Rhodoferax sp.]|nr:hypothetical protein [Rhodoferax sp.]
MLQVIELKRTAKKKGRVRFGRALNQQSIGNRESWNFIVGKKPELGTPKGEEKHSCKSTTKILSTTY